MNVTALQPLIRNFLDSQTSDTFLQEHLSEHKDRFERAQELLQLDRIPNLTREELETFFKNTDAWFGVRGRERLWQWLFGEDDERLPTFKETLGDLVRRGEAGLTTVDFNELLAALPGIGPAYLSEIFALRFPDRYWLWNKPVQSFLEAQDVDIKAELPWGKKGDKGEEYFAAGRYLTALRRTLSEVAEKPVDYLETDLFIYWSNQQAHPTEQTDSWEEQIARWQAEISAERIQHRQEGEARARTLLENKVGQFNEGDLEQFMHDISTDWDKDQVRHNRFMPGLYGSQIKKMAETLAAFNRWAERIWQADDTKLDNILNEFWSKLEVSGAGVSLPTALLYLRNPQQYNKHYID